MCHLEQKSNLMGNLNAGEKYQVESLSFRLKELDEEHSLMNTKVGFQGLYLIKDIFWAAVPQGF